MEDSLCIEDWGGLDLEFQHVVTSATGEKLGFIKSHHLKMFLREVKRGDVSAVRDALRKESTMVHWYLDEGDADAEMYKGRKRSFQAIHMLAMYASEPDRHIYLDVLQELLEARADIASPALSHKPHISDARSHKPHIRKCEPIHLAAAGTCRSMLRELVKQNADPNAPALVDEQFHYYPIHDAVFCDRTDNVKDLIALRASVNMCNNIGQSPLHLACQIGSGPELVALLMDSFADLNLRNQDEREAFSDLCSCKYEQAADSLKLFMRRGFSPDIDSLCSLMMDPDHKIRNAKRFLEATCYEVPLDARFTTYSTYLHVAPRTLQDLFPKDFRFHQVEFSHVPLEFRREQKTFWDAISGAVWTQADLYVCGINNICCLKVLDAIKRTPCDDVLKAGVVQAIVEDSWSSIWLFHTITLFSNICVLLVMCGVAHDIRSESRPRVWWVVILAISLGIGILSEIGQVIRHTMHRAVITYFEFQTILGWVWLCISAAGIHALVTFNGNMHELGRISLLCGAQWMRIMYTLRGYECFGPRLLPILRAIVDTAVFGLIVACCFGAGIHAYYVASSRDSPNPFYAAFLPIYRLGLLGDFDLQELEDTDTVYVQDGETWEPVDPAPSKRYVLIHLIFFATSSIITIILMNLFIGVLGANYDIYEERARELFLRERAHLICRYWHRFLWCAKRRSSKISPDLEGNRHLWFAVRKDSSSERLRSMRGMLSYQLVELKGQQEATMASREIRQRDMYHVTQNQLKVQQEKLEDVYDQLQDLHTQSKAHKEKLENLDTKLDILLGCSRPPPPSTLPPPPPIPPPPPPSH